MSSPSRQRRTRSTKKSSKSATQSTKRATSKPSESPKTPKTPKKTSKKSNRTLKNKSNSKNKSEILVDSDCGFEMIKGDGGEQKKRSLRLREVRLRKEEESESDSESDTNTNNKSNKRKRSRSMDKTPPKKKAKKTLAKKANPLKFMVSKPSFMSDDARLVQIGIAYHKKKRAKKSHHRSQVKYNDKIYKWHKTEKYKIKGIVGHKLDFSNNCDEANKAWYDTINYGPIQQMMDHSDNESDNENSNSNNNSNGDTRNGVENKEKEKEKEKENDSESKQPQVFFGKLMFECKWEDWGETSWETWDKIGQTSVFGKYCQDKNWDVNDELVTCVDEHADEDMHRITMNMGLFGNVTTRKALKMLLSKELDVW